MKRVTRPTFDDMCKATYQIIASNPGVTVSEMVELLNRHNRNIHDYCEVLEREGRIYHERTARRGAFCWYPKEAQL